MVAEGTRSNHLLDQYQYYAIASIIIRFIKSAISPWADAPPAIGPNSADSPYCTANTATITATPITTLFWYEPSIGRVATIKLINKMCSPREIAVEAQYWKLAILSRHQKQLWRYSLVETCRHWNANAVFQLVLDNNGKRELEGKSSGKTNVVRGRWRECSSVEKNCSAAMQRLLLSFICVDLK